MAVDPQGTNSSEFDIESPLLAAGGNSSAERRARVKSQLRDRFGRWIEMGRDNKIKVRLNGKTVTVIGKFVGASPDKPGYGMFVVKNDPNGIPDGVYHFKGKAVSAILASLDSAYLKEKGIRLGHDVNNNPIGDVLDDDIEDINDIKREEIGALDESLAEGTLDKKEKASEAVARLQAPKHESHNVVARLDEVTKEDASKGADAVEEALTPDQQYQRDMMKSDALSAARGYDDENGTLESLIKSDAPLDDIHDFIAGTEKYKNNRKLLQDARGKDMYSPQERSAERQMSDVRTIMSDLARSRGIKAYMPREQREEIAKVELEDISKALDVLGSDPTLQERYGKDKLDAKIAEIKAMDDAFAARKSFNDFYNDVYNTSMDKSPSAQHEGYGNEWETDPSHPALEKARQIFPPSHQETRLEFIRQDKEARDAFGGFPNLLPRIRDVQGSTSQDEENQKLNKLESDIRNAKERKATLPETKQEEVVQTEASPLNDAFDKVLKATGVDLSNPATNDTDAQARDTMLHMSDLIEQVGDTESVSKGELYDRLADSVIKHYENKKNGTHAGEKFAGKADTIPKITERKEGTTIDPFTFSQNRKGIAVAVEGTNEEILDTVFFDEKLGDLALADYVSKNIDKFDGTFKLGTWHDQENNEVTLDVIELFPEANRDEAITAGQNRNQQGIFKLSNKEYIYTGGTGDRGRARRERENARGEGSDRPSSGQGRVGSPDSSGTGSQSEFPSPTDGGDAGKSSGAVAQTRPLREPIARIPLENLPPITGDHAKDTLAMLDAHEPAMLEKIKNQEHAEAYKQEFDEARQDILNGNAQEGFDKIASASLRILNELYSQPGTGDEWTEDNVDRQAEHVRDMYWIARSASNKAYPADVARKVDGELIPELESLSKDFMDSPEMTKFNNLVAELKALSTGKSQPKGYPSEAVIDKVQEIGSHLMGMVQDSYHMDEDDDEYSIKGVDQWGDLQPTAKKLLEFRKSSDNGFMETQPTKATGVQSPQISDAEGFTASIPNMIETLRNNEDTKAILGDFLEERLQAIQNAETPDEAARLVSEVVMDTIRGLAGGGGNSSFDASDVVTPINKHKRFKSAFRPDVNSARGTGVQNSPVTLSDSPDDFPNPGTEENPKNPSKFNSADQIVDGTDSVDDSDPIDMTATIGIQRAADVTLNTRRIDKSMMSEGQKKVLRSMIASRNKAIKALKQSVDNNDTEAYARNYAYVKATTDAINTLVGGVQRDGKNYVFGSGEEERVKSFLIIDESTVIDQDGNVEYMEGYYTAKSGKTYLAKWNNRQATIFALDANGRPSKEAGYVRCYGSEDTLGPEHPRSVTPSYLQTHARYRRDGIGGASITFARLATMKSGKHFSHSASLTPMGANNSKGIDRHDPDRHHMSQAEKVLHLMGSPAIEAMKRAGWFEQDYVMSEGYSHKSFRDFLKPLSTDPSPSYGSGAFTGPLYTLDNKLQVTARDARTRKARGEDVFSGVDYPKFMEEQVNSEHGNLDSYSIRRLMTEASYKDGPSKEEVVSRLKEMRQQFAEYTAGLAPADQNDYSQRWRDGENAQIDKSLGELINSLENFDEFDEQRIDRPKPFPIDDFKTVSSQPYGSIEAAGTSKKFDFGNGDNSLDYVGVSIDYDRPNGYEMKFGERPPADWTGSPNVVARRFSRETLETALKNALAKGDGDFNGELDFARQYAETPQVLPISSHVLGNALVEQGVPINEVRGIIADALDKRNGNTELADKLKETIKPKVSLVEEMDKMLRSLGIKDTDMQKQVELNQAGKPGSYDAENKMAVSSARGKDSDSVALDMMSMRNTGVGDRHAPLIDNDKFDYSNGNEDVLGAPPVQQDWRELSRDLPFGTTANAPYIADNFRTEDLVDAFRDALLEERSTVNLKFAGGAVASVPLASVRDALQHKSVDTNGLARSVLSGGNRSERDAQLKPTGRIVPRPANEVVEHANTVLNLDNFEVVQRHLGGVNSPELWRDPATGKQYIVKSVTNFQGKRADYGQRYVDQEIATQAYYRALGINASMPQRGSYNGNDNYVVAEYIEAMPGLSFADVMEYDPATNDPDGKHLAAIRNGLIGDLFLDQIDGPFNTENVILDKDGNLVRIDGGGGLLWDPIPGEGPKEKTGRFEFGVGGFVSPTPEQEELFKQANKDGSFDSPGAKFSLDYFLNPKGWHWRVSNEPRTRLLEGDHQEEFKNQARELLLENMTPDKIDKVARIIRDPRDRGRVVEGLIMRRKAILDHFGIEDTYDANAADLSSRVPYPSQLDEAGKLIEEMSPHLKTAEINDYLGMLNGRDTTAGEVTDLIKSLKDLKTSRAEESNSTTTEQLLEDTKKGFEDAKNASETTDEISQPNSDPVEIIQPMDKTANQLFYGDLVINRDGSTVGRVLFRNTTPDGKQYVGMLDDNNNFVEKQYDHNENVTIDTGTRKRQDIPNSEIPAGTLRETPQGVEYVNKLRSRSNQVINKIKQDYPNATQLANGDLIVSKRTFTEASRQRRTFEYETVVHRLPNEKFVAYVRRTQIDADGNKIGETVVGRISKETHSAVHLGNRIKPLIRGGRFKGIQSDSPNNWFANSPDLQNEVIHPGTKMPVPASLAPSNLNQQYIGDTGIETTGDPIKDALINHVADMITRGHDAATVLRRMNGQTVLSKQQIADVADRVQANRAFPGVNQVPYVSRDGVNLVRQGDRVRHYGADGVVREGWVRGRQPLIVNRRPQGDYGYTDVLRVQFDDGTRSPIVAKNLEIVRRADGSAPEIRDMAGIAPRATAYDEPTGLPSGFAVRDEVGDVRTFKKGDNPTEHTQGKIVKVTNRDGNTEYVAFAWERGKSTSDLFDWSRRVSDKNVAQAWLIAKMNESESANQIADDVRSALRSNPSAPPQAPRAPRANEVVEDFPEVTPPSPLSRMSKAEYKVEENGGDTTVTMSNVEGIDDANLPVSKITKDKKNRTVILTYANKADADMDKGGIKTKARKNETPEQLQNKAMEAMKKAVEYEVTGPHSVLGVEIPYGDFHALRSSSIGKKYFLDPATNGGAIITPEREAEYERILQNFLPDSLKPSGSGKPRIFFTGGGPGAGKSGLSQRKGDTPGSRKDDPKGFIRHLVPTTDEWEVDGTRKKRKFKGEPEGVMINPDDLKLQLPEVQDMHFRLMQASDPNSGVTAHRGDKDWAGAAHEESSLLAKILYKRAVERQVDIVYDGTGDDTVAKMKKKADTARGAGYSVIGLYLNASPVDAMARANLRQEDSFRSVPKDIQLDTFVNLARMLMPTDEAGNPVPNILSGIFDEFVLYDNSSTSRGELPVLLGHSEGDGSFDFNGDQAQVAFNRIRDYVPNPTASIDDPRHKENILKSLESQSKRRTRELRAEKITYQQQQAKQREKDIKDGKEVEEDLDSKKLSNSMILNSISGATGLSPSQITSIPGVAAMIRRGADLADIQSYVRSMANG